MIVTCPHDEMKVAPSPPAALPLLIWREWSIGEGIRGQPAPARAFFAGSSDVAAHWTGLRYVLGWGGVATKNCAGFRAGCSESKDMSLGWDERVEVAQARLGPLGFWNRKGGV